MKMLRSMLGSSSRPKPSLSTYDGNLSAEGLIDWIGELDRYFDYEEVEEDKKMKLVVTRLKGHIALWWDSVQVERKKKKKLVIKSWYRMVAKMRGKFLPKNYQLGLYKQMQNLRQSMLTMREYTEEFYKVNLRASYIEDTFEKTARYINGLRMDIQEEMSMLSPSVMEEAYQYALKAKEKIRRKQNFGRGKGISKGRGQVTRRGRVAVHRDEASGSNQQDQVERGHESRGGIPYQRGRGRGRGRELVYRCYTCNKLSHRSYKCPNNENARQRGNYVAKKELAEVPVPKVDNAPEVGENLLMNKVLLELEKEVVKSSQRKALFRTACKVQGKW